MKVLIINGSPRPDGDTAYVLESLKNRFPDGTEFAFLNAYESNIQPCNDCRYCWENEGCCIRDEMDILWKDDYDVLILASPLYMSFVTPPLFSVISRLNAIWSNHYFLKTSKRMKQKKGILILTGGGDGSPDPAISIAKTAFSFLNAQFDPAFDYIRSLNTNNVSVQDDRDLAGQTDIAINHTILYGDRNAPLVRKANLNDLSRIAEIQIFNYRLFFYPIFKSDEYYFDELRVPSLMKEYEACLGSLYVYDDGVVKGFIKIEGTYIARLFVEPVLQNASVGSRLLEYAMKEHNADHLWALEKNEKAIRFYERHGFTATGEKKPEDGTDEYLVLLKKKQEQPESPEVKPAEAPRLL